MSAKTPARITGHGHTRDGRRAFSVSSQSEPNRWHVVIVNVGHLECDCQASKYGRVCAHRRLVHDRLVRERDAAPLARDNRPFSIFKSV